MHSWPRNSSKWRVAQQQPLARHRSTQTRAGLPRQRHQNGHSPCGATPGPKCRRAGLRARRRVGRRRVPIPWANELPIPCVEALRRGEAAGCGRGRSRNRRAATSRAVQAVAAVVFVFMVQGLSLAQSDGAAETPADTTPALGPSPHDERLWEGEHDDSSDSGTLPLGGPDDDVKSPPDQRAPSIAPLPEIIEPHPAIAPVVDDVIPTEPTQTAVIPVQDRTETVFGVILGLLSLMALAYLGGHRWVLDWEKRLGVSQVITTGLPFILLGMVMRLPKVGILTDSMLTELSPILRIGLGSVGFIAGFRFEAKLFHALPGQAAGIALLSTLVPSALVTAVMAPLLLLLSGMTWHDSMHNPVFLRDALIVATAGAMTARSAVRVFDVIDGRSLIARVLRLEELAGVLGLAFVAAYFRQQGDDDAAALPGMVWLLVTLGLGTALGLVFYTILASVSRSGDLYAVTLGAIAFTSGTAGYFHLSSIAVAFTAGVILSNFPGTFQPRLRAVLKRLERPIYLLALFVIGAVWDVADVRGWALMPIFASARLAGKWLAAAIATRYGGLPLTAEESQALAVSPLGALAIAIVVNAQLLYPGGTISLVVSAVIGGGVLTEVFVQLASRRLGWGAHRTPSPQPESSAAATSAPHTGELP